METATSMLQLTISPDTVYTSTIPGQYSFANLTLTVTNTGDATQVSSVGIMLPSNLYLQGSLSSITPASSQPYDWNFSTTSTAGAFAATSKSGKPVPLSNGASFTFVLNNITLAHQTGQTNVQAVVILGDGTKIPQTFTITIAKATASIAFTAEPTNISLGQSSTLSWQCMEMDYCILTPPPNTDNLPASGNKQLSPETSTTYTLDAFGPGLHLQAQVNVQVIRPQVLGFSADDDYVDYNGFAALNWETEYADTVKLTAAPQVPIPANLPTNTTKAIMVGPLTQATTFTLTPISNTIKGAISSPLIIDINPPTATFVASPTTDVWEKDKVTITWEITNAATITVEPPMPGGPSMLNLIGSVDIYPDDDVNYKLTVTGVEGTPMITETISFDVTQVKVLFMADPNPIVLGNNDNFTTLEWDAQAQAVSIDQGIGGVPITGTHVLPSPANGAVYTLTAGTPQNPALVVVPVTISSQYGPFIFTGMRQQEMNHQTLAVTFNASPGYSSSNHFSLKLEGISIDGAANPVWRGTVSPSSITILCELGADVEWLNPKNPQGTITVIGVAE